MWDDPPPYEGGGPMDGSEYIPPAALEYAIMQGILGPNFTHSQLTPGLSRYIMQEWLSDRNSARGVQDLGPQTLKQSGFAEDCGCSNPEDLVDADMTVGHPKTYIPIKFRMRHHRVCSGHHAALFGARTVLTFHAKKACAAFCRSWNAMMSDIGQASEFIPADLIQAFSDMVIGGSGAYGIENEFSPPFRGRVNV